MTEPIPDERRHTPPAAQRPTAESEFARLCEIVRLLRSPEGCPWDIEQTWHTLAPFVLEEACEVIDAIDRQATSEVCGEIGDLIFEGVLLAQVAADEGRFTVRDSLRAISDKLVRRHPHVFHQPDCSAGTDGRGVATPGAVVAQWQEIKAREREAAGIVHSSAIDGVPTSLPALPQAQALGARAAKTGFDWPNAEGALEKVKEELGELEAEMQAAPSPALDEELGDLLFAVVQCARKLGLDPDASLRAANRKFAARFRALEHEVTGSGRTLPSMALEDLEAVWQRLKRTPKG